MITGLSTLGTVPNRLEEESIYALVGTDEGEDTIQYLGDICDVYAVEYGGEYAILFDHPNTKTRCIVVSDFEAQQLIEGNFIGKGDWHYFIKSYLIQNLNKEDEDDL